MKMLLREEVQELQNTDKLGCEGFGQGACGKQKTENRKQNSVLQRLEPLSAVSLARTAEMEIRFFDSSSEFREWLETNHEHAGELVLGFYKKGSGKKGISYPESLDEALCFGWIDGVRKNLDAISYSIRFTPRKKKSIWSLANLRRVDELKKSGRMKRAGLESHSMRDPAKTGIYSFENATRKLAVDEERKFMLEKGAWDFFQKQTPSYRRMAIWWIVSAKKDETRARRLSLLIEDSARERTLAQFSRSKSN